MNVVVRKADSEDLEAINELTDIMHRHLAALYKLKLGNDEIDEEHFDAGELTNIYVAESAGTGIIGYISFSKGTDEWIGPYYELEHIVVRKDYRSRGVGRELFKVLLDRAEHEGLNIKAGSLARNRLALDFLEELGFKQFSIDVVLDLQNRIFSHLQGEVN